ncbi:unnamed protein product, partial [Symbiodinium necroappetens]
PPPQPVSPLPSWLVKAAAGDFEEFDIFLSKLSPNVEAPDFSHLGGARPQAPADSLVCKSGGRLKLESWLAGAPLRVDSFAEGTEHAVDDCSFLGFPMSQVFSQRGQAPDPSKKGCIDLFCGSGGIARALVRQGAPWVIGFDVIRSPLQDLANPKCQAAVISLVESGAVNVVAMAPPAATFSRAVTPAVRSRRFPYGVPWLGGAMKQKVERDNALAALCLKLVRLCESKGVTWWLEHPDTSLLWCLQGFKRFASPSSTSVWRCDLCFFGTPWRKRTGRSSAYKQAWTALSQPYPRGFCDALARAAARAEGWADASGRLTLSSCARCGHMRIGEAKNPGPRHRLHARDGDLLTRPLQTQTTLVYESKLWDDFVGWCSSVVSDPQSCFSLFPLFAAMALRAYGDWCFTTGRTLSSFRHCVIAVQRRVLGSKPYLSLAWEMVSRWEALEPPAHRCPLPEPMLKAMCALACFWVMRRWAGVTLLAFYGLARIGEVLRCRRSDLLLPEDLLDDAHGALYLCFKSSKTATRGRPKVQHTKVSDVRAVSWISAIFGGLAPDDLLWPSSPAAYRHRWNVLLKHLDVPLGLRLMPGGLRGGGAVHLYRSGHPLTELQWSMRLKHLGTLEHYLQEVAAVTALTDISPHGRSLIRTAAQLFDALGEPP